MTLNQAQPVSAKTVKKKKKEFIKIAGAGQEFRNSQAWSQRNGIDWNEEASVYLIICGLVQRL